MSGASQDLAWVDTHCHLDAPEFTNQLLGIVSRAAHQGVKAILLPTVKASDWEQASNLVEQYGQQIPG
jgi:TatD DNase family protein